MRGLALLASHLLPQVSHLLRQAYTYITPVTEPQHVLTYLCDVIKEAFYVRPHMAL